MSAESKHSRKRANKTSRPARSSPKQPARGGLASENVVARQGIAAWLVLLCAALMGFLSIYTYTLGSIANRLADNWQAALTSSASLRIIAPDDEIDKIAAAATEVLNTSLGIASFEEIPREGQLALLKPWLGGNIPEELLALPRIYAVTINEAQFDEAALLLRLEAEAPEAIWDNHQRWQGPLLKSAARMRLLAWVSTAIIALAFCLLIFLATEASVAANAGNITLLRQIGATDRWIQSGFVRKLTMRAAIGAFIGICLGFVAVYWLVSRGLDRDYLTGGIELGRSHPLAGLVILFLATMLGLFATRGATRRYLERNL